MTKSLNISAVIVAGAILILATVILLKPVFPAFASVSTGGEYQSTTTPTISTNTVLSQDPGALGSVVLTGQNTGTIYLYDATTTNITLRNNVPTSSLLLAQFPANATSSTYTFDAIRRFGLVVVTTSPAPTTTITFR